MGIDTKNKLLFLGTALLLFTSYKLAISRTLALWEESRRLETQVEQFGDIPKKLSLLSQKNSYYDSILGKMDPVDTSVRNNLLRTLNQEAHKNRLNVMTFDKPHVYQMGDNALYTFRFGLKGDFSDILKTVHVVEQRGGFGEVVHIAFEKKKDPTTHTQGLTALVFVQQLK